MQERGSLRLFGFDTQEIPLRLQPGNIRCELLFGGALRGRSDNHTCGFRKNRLQNCFEARALVVGQFARNSVHCPARHIDEVATGQTDLTR